MNTNPTLVVLAADIEVSGAIVDVADLLVLVKMLLVERLHFGFVGVAEALATLRSVSPTTEAPSSAETGA